MMRLFIFLGILISLCRLASFPATLTKEFIPTTTATATQSVLRVAPRARMPSATPSLATPTPESSNKIVIGYSVLRRPLEVYQFGSGTHKRMIVAGIHGGDEGNTIALADELIEYLGKHAEVVPADTTLFILRALNPDGAARGHAKYARANEHGVDLNRNFPALWQADWNRDGCWNYLKLNGGVKAGSEPETQALMKFIRVQKVAALISYHSAALGIFPGGQPADPKSISLAESLARVSDYPFPPLDTGCVFTGQLIDWASMHGVAAVDIELTNHHDTDFEQNLDILNVFLAWQP